MSKVMSNAEAARLIHKTKQVILSCKTHEQFLVALRYNERACTMLIDSDYLSAVPYLMAIQLNVCRKLAKEQAK